MRIPFVCGFLLVLSSQARPVLQTPIEVAASKYVPGVTWQPKSVVAADFTCRGRTEQAILGSSKSEIVIAVFVNGPSSAPEVLRDTVRSREDVELKTETLDYDPKDIVGDLQGFQRSKVCRGLNLGDGMIDSRHIYWNHVSLRFDSWTL
jgi:hypothetical protein